MCSHNADRGLRNKNQYIFNRVYIMFILCLLYGISEAVDRAGVYRENSTGPVVLDTFYIIGTTDHVDKVEIDVDASVKKMTITKTTQGEFCGEFSFDWNCRNDTLLMFYSHHGGICDTFVYQQFTSVFFYTNPVLLTVRDTTVYYGRFDTTIQLTSTGLIAENIQSRTGLTPFSLFTDNCNNIHIHFGSAMELYTAEVKVYSLNGKLITRIRPKAPSQSSVEWSGLNYSGNRVSAGTYLLNISDRTNQYLRTVKPVR